MKHVKKVTVAKAFCGEDHPDLMDSIKGFLEDPAGILDMHLTKDTEEPA